MNLDRCEIYYLVQKYSVIHILLVFYAFWMCTLPTHHFLHDAIIFELERTEATQKRLTVYSWCRIFLFELFLVWTYRLRNNSIPCGCNMPFNFLGSLWMNLLLCVPWHRRLLRQNVQGRVGVDVRIRNENTLLNSTCKACKKWK